MAAPAEPAAVRWRRLLLPGLLALLIHVVLLAWIDLPVEPVASKTTILRPLIYNTPPPPPTQAPAAPVNRPRPQRPAPLVPPPAPMPAPSAVPVEPVAAAPGPAPEAPAPVVTTPPAPPAAPAPATITVPGSVRLKYTLYGELGKLPYHASGELLWAHDGREYEARMEIGAFLLGSRVQHSRGRLTSEGLQPLRFLDKVRNDRVAEFDHTLAQARFSEGSPPAALRPGAQDQLSVFVQLGAQIGAEPARYPAGTELNVQAIGVYGDETWRFVVGEQEELSLPGGTQRALRLTRLPGRGDEPRAEVWLAPALGWLPVRIRLSQPNGDFIDQQWRASEAP